MHTITSITELLNGITEGKSFDLEIERINSLEKARKGEISFLNEPKFEKFLYSTKATVVVVDESFVPKSPIEFCLIRVKDIKKAYIHLLELFQTNNIFEEGQKALNYVSKDAKLHPSVKLGNFCHIAEGVEVGEGSKIASQVYLGKHVKIGKDVSVFPGVKIYHETIIGDNCIIHSNAVIGSDGFGFSPSTDGHYEKIPQVGCVVIEANVEIGANTVIDRSTFGTTLIKEGVKLDNLVQVAHNVEIGKNTVIAAQSGISGSVTLGDACVVGGQSAFVPHIKIANGSQFQGKSGVSKSIKKENGKYYGYPAIGFNDYIRSFSVFKILPKLEKRLRKVENELKTQNKK